MIGEFLCLIVYYIGSRGQAPPNMDSVPKHVFLVACLFDWTATTLVNMAYVMIAASIVQMTRGAVVIFTCIFSVLFLGRRQHTYHVVGVCLVFIGITLVSLSVFFNPASSENITAGTNAYHKVLGISLCVGSQVFQALMLVYEERIMSKYTVPPLLVVGMEGTFGILFGAVLLAVLNAVSIESTPAALYQMGHSVPLLRAGVISIFTVAFFNFSGVTVTQQASAVARSTIDVSRTILIWCVELMVGWNMFNGLQLAGFIILATGTLIYNRLLVIQHFEPSQETLALLSDKDDEIAPKTLLRELGRKCEQVGSLPILEKALMQKSSALDIEENQEWSY